MADLFALEAPGKIYWDRKTYATFNDHVAALTGSRFLYVGNLSFYTTEAQIVELFSKVGEVVRVIMGLDRNKHTPCGFCFVEFRHSGDALAAVNFISGTCLDERIIRAELDPGFKEGRQYGRGISGGQVRDERWKNSDPARNIKTNSEQHLSSSYGASTSNKIVDENHDTDEYGRIVKSFSSEQIKSDIKIDLLQDEDNQSNNSLKPKKRERFYEDHTFADGDMEKKAKFDADTSVTTY